LRLADNRQARLEIFKPTENANDLENFRGGRDARCRGGSDRLCGHDRDRIDSL